MYKVLYNDHNLFSDMMGNIKQIHTQNTELET